MFLQMGIVETKQMKTSKTCTRTFNQKIIHAKTLINS